MDDAAVPSREHLTAPRGRGRLAARPAAGAAGGAACGDLVRVAVRVEGERVAEAGFEPAAAPRRGPPGSAVVELVEGARSSTRRASTPDDVDAELGGLTPGEAATPPTLAADALHRALGAAARDGAPQTPSDRGRTLVAMSGGVDSAVAAQLATRRAATTSSR